SGSKVRRGLARLAMMNSTGSFLTPPISVTRAPSTMAMSPMSAARPRPRRVGLSFMDGLLCRVELPLAADHFGGQPQIGLATSAFQIIEQSRLAIGRRLAQPHIAGNDRVIDQVAHFAAHILQ